MNTSDVPAEHRPPDFMTVPEVAAAFRVSRATIYRLVEGGSLAATRIGKSVRVSRPAVDEFLRRNAHGATDPQTD